jgi:ribosomal protein S18 acetylase RimI-like enzyme
MLNVQIRTAVGSDLDALSALALEAKAHWGYSAETMRGWHGQLRLAPPDLLAMRVHVAELDGAIAGFYALLPAGESWALEHLWVAPQYMQRGIGRVLLAHALKLAFAGGATKLTADADPNAEAFYASQGAIRAGDVPAPIAGDAGRVRPQMVFLPAS